MTSAKELYFLVFTDKDQKLWDVKKPHHSSQRVEDVDHFGVPNLSLAG